MRVSDRNKGLRSFALGCLGAVAISVLFAQCNKSPTQPSPGSQGGVPGPNPTPPLPQTPGPAIFVGAGDIAIANGHDDSTAKLLDSIGGDVFTLGDDAYPNGSPENFKVFDRAWGRFLGRMHPAPGNHEYMTPGAAGYFGYFGAIASPPGNPPGQGFYSFDLGAWHLISLNSNYEFGVAVDAGSPQAAWLQADLASHSNKCTLAYWHHPLFSSGQNGDYRGMRPIFDILYNANADVVLNGHDHLYERFGPQTGDGRPDQARGIREFIVGTGGVNPDYRFVTSKLNSEKQITGQNGVLKLTLLADSYLWEFVTAPNSAVIDSGTGQCH
jgi:calcineurin-like phosphoesterase family protein